jgi:hypothetical protein
MARFSSHLTVVTAALVAWAVLPAAAIVVTNLDDSGTGSLRQAVIDANTNAGADVITFQPGLTGTIHLTTGEIAITDSVDIQGPGARLLAIDSTARIFNINGSIDVGISGLTLTGAKATSNGGAIANNTANVTLDSDTLSGNSTTNEGGAIFHNANGGVFTIKNSTLSGNMANKAGAIYSVGFNLVIINSTISGNKAADSVGGIKLEFAFASISNSTVSGNSAKFSQGGILAGTGNNRLDLVSTIVANNTDVTGASDLARFAGTVNASNSLIGQSLAVGVINGTNVGNEIGVDPLLGALANNGGPTNTQALNAGSPAIDTGSNPLGLLNDQRGPGFKREFGPGPDIGAFELQPIHGVPALSSLGLAVLGIGLLFVGTQLVRRRLLSL